MSYNSPRLDLPYIQPAHAQKHVTHNEALRMLDMLVQLALVGFDGTTLPNLPQEDDFYAHGAGAVVSPHRAFGHAFVLAGTDKVPDIGLHNQLKNGLGDGAKKVAASLLGQEIG